MQVFISHKIVEDGDLAVKLQQSLSKENISGYIAELKQEYDILISDKIKTEIEKSDYLIVIITQVSRNSASVHEEIGYALGKNIPVLILLEESVNESGVLIFGKEPELFIRSYFDTHADKITAFLKEKGIKRDTQNIEQSNVFLDERNLDLKSNTFAENENTQYLWTRIDDSLIPNGKPYVLFSACPKKITNRVDVNSKVISDWLNLQRIIMLDLNNKCIFLEGNKKIKQNSVSYHHSPRGDEQIYKYTEFNKNGFIEQGITRPIIFQHSDNNGTHPCLQSCFLTGAFWAFLIFCRQYYKQIEFNEEFDVFLSIHNSRDLALAGFGGTLNASGMYYVEPYSFDWNISPIPKTNDLHVQLSVKSLTGEKLTDGFIQTTVKKISDELANAFGLEFARCYNYDGSLNFNKFNYYN